MKRALLSALAAALLLAGCGQASDPAFDAKVRDYLLRHPEVLEEAIQKLQEKRTAEAERLGQQALARLRPQIERDRRDFVANPNGAITVTEFYDYRCGHCINIAPKVATLIRQNPDVRFVFKEMPIFGGASDRAAVAAIAVKRGGGDYVRFYETMMATRGLDEAAVDRIAAAHGADVGLLGNAAFVQEASTQIADAKRLAAQLGIEGTPAFIVGDTIIRGEDEAALNAAIQVQRQAARG